MTLSVFHAGFALANAAEKLWDAHCKTHDERQHPDRGLNPTKYAMNYGELNDLKKALDDYRAAQVAHAAELRAEAARPRAPK